MRHPAPAAVLAAASLLGAGSACANRPLATDTADTVPNGRCQFEPYVGSNRSDATPTERFWVLQLNCGVTANTQLGANLARDWNDTDAANALAFTGKTTLVELKDGQTGFALGYGLNASRPRGDAWSTEGGLLSGIASRQLADGWLVHANLGWTHSRSAHRSSTTWALATEYDLTTAAVFSAELYGDDRVRPWTSLGLLWKLGVSASVNVSYGVQSSSPRVRQFTAGFLVEF